MLSTIRRALLCAVVLFTMLGCTTTDEVVNSWVGYPIQDVIAQWGIPGCEEWTDAAHGNPSHFEVTPWAGSTQQGVVDGESTYRWTRISHNFYPRRVETVCTKRDDRVYYTTRVIPERWNTQTRWFSLTTDENGLVVSGRSSYQQAIFPFSRFIERSNGLGSPRQE